MDYRYRGIQFGIARRHDTVDGLSKIYRGLYGSFLTGTGEYDGGTVKGHQYTIGYYHSKQWDHRYSDFVLRFSHQKNDFDTVDTKKESVFAKDISSKFFSISEEVGRRYEWVQLFRKG